MSGFDSKIYINKPCDSYNCPLCLNVINDPRQCQNGHMYCNECIRSAISVRKECPVCKIYLVPENLGRCLVVQNITQSLPTLCISKFNLNCKTESGSNCEWTGPMLERASHFEHACEYRVAV